jgi:hypothetical protein
MALVRFGNKPSDVRDLGPARGRLNVSGFIAMGGPLTADASRQTKNAQHQRKPVGDKALSGVSKNLDNGGVESPKAEVQS